MCASQLVIQYASEFVMLLAFVFGVKSIRRKRKKDAFFAAQAFGHEADNMEKPNGNMFSWQGSQKNKKLIIIFLFHVSVLRCKKKEIFCASCNVIREKERADEVIFGEIQVVTHTYTHMLA